MYGTDTYTPPIRTLIRVRSFFLYHLKETTYTVHPLAPTTNVPNGPIQTIGHL